MLSGSILLLRDDKLVMRLACGEGVTKEDLPILRSSSKPRSRKPSEAMHPWVNREMASKELLRSEVVSSLSWVGRASARCFKIEGGASGSVDMFGNGNTNRGR